MSEPRRGHLSPIPRPPTPERTVALDWVDVLDGYLEHCRVERRVRPASIYLWDHLLRSWHAHLAGMPWYDATSVELAGFLRRRSPRARRPDGELSPETHAAGLQAVRGLYRWAHEIGLLLHNPMGRVRSLPARRQEPRALTHAQLAAILAVTQGHCRACQTRPGCVHRRRWRLAVHLGYHAGLRAMESAALRWEDVHEHAAVPHLLVRSGKGGQPGRVALAPALRQVLADERPSPGAVGPVLTHGRAPGDTAHMTASSVSQLLGRVLEAAGVAESGHALRHTLAAHLEEAGVPVLDIMRILRHSSLAMTTRYLQGVRDRTPDALALLPDPLAGESA